MISDTNLFKDYCHEISLHSEKRPGNKRITWMRPPRTFCSCVSQSKCPSLGMVNVNCVVKFSGTHCLLIVYGFKSVVFPVRFGVALIRICFLWKRLKTLEKPGGGGGGMIFTDLTCLCSAMQLLSNSFGVWSNFLRLYQPRDSLDSLGKFSVKQNIISERISSTIS